MKTIYETEKYAGRMDVDYEALRKMSDQLVQESPNERVPIISYARVSTPRQIKGTSLQIQHKSNVEAIRENFDNPIVFVTEVGSGANRPGNRILYEALEQAPRNTALYAMVTDRLTRSIENFMPIAQIIDEKSIWLFTKDAENGNYVLWNRDALISPVFEECRKRYPLMAQQEYESPNIFCVTRNPD